MLEAATLQDSELGNLLFHTVLPTAVIPFFFYSIQLVQLSVRFSSRLCGKSQNGGSPADVTADMPNSDSDNQRVVGSPTVAHC